MRANMLLYNLINQAECIVGYSGGNAAFPGRKTQRQRKPRTTTLKTIIEIVAYVWIHLIINYRRYKIGKNIKYLSLEHSSNNFLLFFWRLGGERDLLVPSHLFNLFLEDSKEFPGWQWNVISSACPGSAVGNLLTGHARKTILRGHLGGSFLSEVRIT